MVSDVATAADDLRALGIDRAETRWRAVRAYMRQQERVATEQWRSVLIAIVAEGMAEDSARAAGRYPWVRSSDYDDAFRRIEGHLAAAQS